MYRLPDLLSAKRRLLISNIKLSVGNMAQYVYSRKVQLPGDRYSLMPSHVLPCLEGLTHTNVNLLKNLIHPIDAS